MLGSVVLVSLWLLCIIVNTADVAISPMSSIARGIVVDGRRAALDMTIASSCSTTVMLDHRR